MSDDMELNNLGTEGQQYELAYILKDESAELRIFDILTKYKAEIVTRQKAQKIKLAYEIKKQSEAYFGFVSFAMKPGDVGILDKELKFLNDVLRFLIIRANVIEEKEKMQDTTSEIIDSPNLRQEIESAPTISGAPSKTVLSNEELKAKLQEISQ